MALESRLPLITVMTSQDASLIFRTLEAAATDDARLMPPGVQSIDDLKAIMRDGVAFFVAYRNTVDSPEPEPAGTIGYRWEEKTLRVFHVAVRPDLRRSGVARRLLEALEAVGVALGTTNLSLTLEAESALRNLFEGAGFNPSTSGLNIGNLQLRKAVSERLV